MTIIDTEYLEKCLLTLEKSYDCLLKAEKASIEYEMYRNSLIKGFEITLEQSGNLLRKFITPYFASKKSVDALTYKSIFREAHKHGIIDEACVERWFTYRDNRNDTVHDYGEDFAESTLLIVDDFLKDVKSLIKIINEVNSENG